MKLKITINLDNEKVINDLSRILHDIADNINDGGTDLENDFVRIVRDINGDAVGFIEIE